LACQVIRFSGKLDFVAFPAGVVMEFRKISIGFLVDYAQEYNFFQFLTI
jgi:hypothetical protein